MGDSLRLFLCSTPRRRLLQAGESLGTVRREGSQKVVSRELPGGKVPGSRPGKQQATKSSTKGVKRTFPPEAAPDVFCQVKWPRNRQRKVNCPENRQIEAMNFTIERANRNRFSGNRQATADYSCN